MEHFKLIITIVDRGKGGKAVDLYRRHHLHFDFACLGAGTASSKILNYFGLDETAKELVWTLAPVSRISIPLAREFSSRCLLRVSAPKSPLCLSSRNMKRRTPLWKKRKPPPKAIPISWC